MHTVRDESIYLSFLTTGFPSLGHRGRLNRFGRSECHKFFPIRSGKSAGMGIAKVLEGPGYSRLTETGSLIPRMMRSLYIGFFLAGFLSTASAFTNIANSVNYSDVLSAYNLCSDGDTLRIPAGSATWSSTLSVNKGISIIGAGTNSTTISGSGFSFISISLGSDKPVRVSGIRFNINAYNSTGGRYPIAVWGSTGGTYAYTRIRIDHCWFEQGQYVITLTGARVYGVIDHNTFHNPDNGVQMNGDRYTWNYPIVPGTTNCMVIEDNLFLADLTPNGDNNECIMSGHGVRFVVRHNTFDGTAFNDSFLPYENHGQGNAYTGTDNDLRGPPIFEIYNNVMKAKQTYRFMNIRGGSSLVYSNVLTVASGPAAAIQLTEDFELRIPPQYLIWAGEDQVNNSFFWSNTLNGVLVNSVSLYDSLLITFLQQGRDYWMHPPDNVSGKTIWTDRPGSHNEQFVSGPQLYYPYVPLVYPHPMITAQDGGGGQSTSGLSVFPASLDFGTVALGGTSNLTLTVRNTGGGTISGNAVVPAGPFGIVGSSSYSLVSNASQVITVRFAPTQAGSASQTVTFTGGSGASVTVSGIAPLGTVFQASAGTISSPFTINADSTISQAVQTDETSGGRATYTFNIANAGNYGVAGVVSAPSESANSFYVNIDGEPADPDMIWDIPVYAGTTNRPVTWRVTGGMKSQVWNLSAGTHQLIVRGREAGVTLGNITISKAPDAPPGVRIAGLGL
jgi:hypothetical protein